MWERRNSKSQPSCGGHTSFLTSLFLGLYSNNFHLHSTPVAHFLDFIIYQSQLLNRKPHYHSYGSYLLIYRAVTLNQKKNQCLSESPENFTTLLPVHIYILSLSVSLGLCLSLSRAHTHTHTSPLKTLLVQLWHLFLLSPSQPENHWFRKNAKFPDAPALFMPLKSFKMSQ